MCFRMDDILFLETKIILSFLLIISSLFMCIDFGIFIFVFVSISLILYIHAKTPRKYIFINEIGIACYFKDECIWQHNWDEILELRIGNRYRHKSIEILLKLSNNDETPKYSYHYFQYGKSAKKALEIYYDNHKQSGDG